MTPDEWRESGYPHPNGKTDIETIIDKILT